MPPPAPPLAATTMTLPRGATPDTVRPLRSLRPSWSQVCPPSVERMMPLSGPPLPPNELMSPMPATTTALSKLLPARATVGSSASALIDMLGPRSRSGVHVVRPMPPVHALSARQTPPFTVPIHTTSEVFGCTTTAETAPTTGLSHSLVVETGGAMQERSPVSPLWMWLPCGMKSGAPKGTAPAVKLPPTETEPVDMKPGVSPALTSATLMLSCSCWTRSSGEEKAAGFGEGAVPQDPVHPVVWQAGWITLTDPSGLVLRSLPISVLRGSMCLPARPPAPPPMNSIV